MPPRTRTPKPKAHDETVRVLRVYDWLREELANRGARASLDPTGPELRAAALAVAERIAARTED